MALGRSQAQQRFENPREIFGDRLKEGSIYRLLADHGHQLFDDDYFADLYNESVRGRPTIAARVMATVMLLQAFEGLSDADATDRLSFDLRWQAAAGVDTGYESFHPTSLVGQRNRLRSSERPRRLFEDTKVVAKETGALKSRARVLDSTPLYDAVATQDTVTQLRAAIRKLLAALDQAASPLAGVIRSTLLRDDEYATVGKPPCDWDDKAAREALVDALVRDASAALGAIDGEALPAGRAGGHRPVGPRRRPRHTRGRRRGLSHRGRCGQRPGHLNRRPRGPSRPQVAQPSIRRLQNAPVHRPRLQAHRRGGRNRGQPDRDAVDDLLEGLADQEDKPEILGDSAYADGATRKALGDAGFEVVAKVPPVRNATGLFTKDRFSVDLVTHTVACPAGRRVAINPTRDGGGRASFKVHCKDCPLRRACTKSRSGRTIAIGRHEDLLQMARSQQSTPEWQARYRADRPKVERKISHFARRAWGGRNARVRGRRRISSDVDTRAGALNLARLAVLGLGHDGDGWSVAAG